ncbi:protein HEADING DATE 3B-like isoform X1 [Lycium ferocissimum]|uniref:protein HEADING DATE 3B-like isoform X1 n=2 Tax=Lycium ferocissimum TaxID=112874 RepID=UPI002815867F|nr:protein HEADING DATE 3B-like isoform X1 [Lycium ferocissimum]
MNVGKDEERGMDPLFPRLHINDADKGGPRAPPRNKMALCEQSSRSPQRLTSTSAPAPGTMSMLPLPPNRGNSIPAASSSLVGCNKRSLFSHNSSESSHFVEILHPYSSGGTNFTMRRPDIQPVKSLNPQVLCLKGNLRGPSQFNPIQPQSLSYSNSNPSANKFGRENDFFGPQFVASGKPIYHGNIHKSADKEKMAISSSKPSLKYQGVFEKQFKDTGSMQLKWSEHSAKLPAPHLSTVEKIVVRQAPSPGRSELNIKSLVSSAPENRCGLVGDLNRCSDSNSESDEDSWIMHKRKAAEDVTYVKQEDATTNRHASVVEGPSCSFLPHGDNHQSPKRVKSSSDCPEGLSSGPPEVGGRHRSEGISEASSNSRLVEKLSSDNVIALIGQELFWKARRTIAHQQRIFAMQLFELHRLTKVQKMIARSPDILLKDNFCIHQPSINFSSLKNLPCDEVIEPPVVAVEQKISPKPNNFEHPADNAYLPLPKDNDKKNIPQLSAQKPNVGPVPTSRSFVSDPKLAPRCYQPPPGYQWLVPIRSPSEGLVYKPYTGPCPPPGGIIAPVYGSSRPATLSPTGGDFANVPYSVQTSHKQGVGIFPGPAIFDQSCIQPYSMPVIKPSASSSAIEQMNPFSRIMSSEKENSPFMPRKKTCNISCQKSAVMSDCDRTFQASRGSDMQVSTANSPPERAQKDALSLFPITPTAKGSDQPVQDNNAVQRIQVIKVVPHNPKSASESAARIFKSIQEERKLNY